MDKRQRLERTLLGDATDRAPVALWRHWPGDDQRSVDFARTVVGFQRAYDWDLINVTPYSTFAVSDYGLQSEWTGRSDGDREVIRRPIQRSLHWTDLRPLDPLRGELGKYLETLRLIADALGNEADTAPIIATVPSPLTQAMQLAGTTLARRHLRTQPERFFSGINTLTESTQRLVDALRRTPIAGIYYSMDHANYVDFSLEEYRSVAMPADLQVLEAASDRWWLTMLHLGGAASMFDLAASYPVPVIHWDNREARPDVANARTRFDGALCTGVDHAGQLQLGTPSQIRDTVRGLLGQSGGRRLIAGASGHAYATTPRANLRAVREAVETA